MSAAPARVFVALALGPELGPALAREVRAALGGAQAGDTWRLPRPEGLHATLHFLGDVARERLGELAAALAEALAGCAAPRLVLRGAGAFPERSRPRVLWIGVEEARGEGRLAALRAATLAGLERAGIDVERARRELYTPHVTVARPRGKAAAFPSAFEDWALAQPWRPEEVLLLESCPDPLGSRYAAVARFPLPPDRA